MNYEKISVKKYIVLFFLMYSFYFYAMQPALDQIIPEDVVTKIIACCEPRDRNQLVKVNKNFKKLAARKNTSILYYSPLKLGKNDAAFYMMYHCDEGNINIVRNLLENGADPNPKIMLNISPIVLAFQNKHYEIASLLKEYLPKQNVQMNVASPVAMAVYKGDIGRVKYFCQFGWNLPTHDNLLLHTAVTNNDVGMVSLLVKCLNPESILIKDINGDCPFHCLTDRGSMDIVQLLLPFFSVDEKNKFGRTPLFTVANKGRVHAVDLLLDYKASINTQDTENNTALHCAVHNQQKHVVKLLLDRGAQLNMQNAEGDTPLHIAVINNYIKIAALLLAHSARTDILNIAKKTALDCALEHNEREELVTLLSRYGADKKKSAPWIYSVSNFFDVLKNWW